VRVNLTGAFLTVPGAVRAMAGRGGSIVLIGSPTAVTGEGADFAAYSSSKAGMHGLGRSVAAAYAADGIRVNTVVPGYTETPLVATIAGDAEARRAIVGRTPLGRPGTPPSSRASRCSWRRTSRRSPPAACSASTAA
jgi:NAD(P)-dependent dehydrogenase (short-subunit alcohol dehydrogenase family)